MPWTATKAISSKLVVDKLKPSEGDVKRVRDSVAAALSIGKGSVALLEVRSGQAEAFLQASGGSGFGNIPPGTRATLFLF